MFSNFAFCFEIQIVNAKFSHFSDLNQKNSIGRGKIWTAVAKLSHLSDQNAEIWAVYTTLKVLKVLK